MRAAPVVLTAFPLALVGVLAAERFALLSLGADPGSAAAWEFWLNLHLAFGRVWQALEPILGGLRIQPSARAPAGRGDRRAGCELAAVAVLFVPLQPHRAHRDRRIVDAGYAGEGVEHRRGEFASPGHWAVTWAAQFSSAQLLMLFGGLASCLLCHVAVLGAPRQSFRAGVLADQDAPAKPLGHAAGVTKYAFT